MQLKGCCHRAIAADDNECSYSNVPEDLFSLLDYFWGHGCAIARANFPYEMPAICRPDDGAAQCHNSIGAFMVENDVIPRREEPFESIAKTNDFPAEFFRREHDTAQNSV